MNRTTTYTSRLLLAFIALTCMTSCNNYEDFLRFLTGKTWKMSRLTEKDSSKQFCITWDDEDDYEVSMSYFSVSSYYVVSFNGAEIDGELVGNDVSMRGVDVSATGTWTADGSTRAMTLNLTFSGATTETDPLAELYIYGMQNVYRYEGDENNLNLFFKDDGQTYVIGFTPR